MSFHLERFFVFTVSSAIAGAFACLPAEARSHASLDTSYVVTINETAPTLAPFQHVRFCLQYPNDCKASTFSGHRVVLDDKMMNLLKQVNHRVNASIQAVVKTYGANLSDGWTISPDMGDCNDYAVTKRHQLLALGIPSSVLRLSVVRTSWGEGHLVLTVATTKGDYVLDNLTETIRPWKRTNYQWIKIQSAENPKYWHHVGSSVVSTSLLQDAAMSDPASEQPAARPAPEPATSPAPIPVANDQIVQQNNSAMLSTQTESVVSCAGLLAEVPLVL